MWETILLPLTWSWTLFQLSSEAALPLLRQNRQQVRTAWHHTNQKWYANRTVHETVLQYFLYIFLAGVFFCGMATVLMESTLKPWSSKKSWTCRNREGEQPAELKFKLAGVPLHQSLLVCVGVGFFPTNKPLWGCFVVAVLYNKIDCREWFLSDRYWKLCMWIPGFFCLMLLSSFHWLELWGQWDYMKH